MTARRLVISGRVHNVGFRDWMVAQADELRLIGWVRNILHNRAVEALIDGEEAAVEEMLRRCRRGPRAAQVTDIEETLAEPVTEPGFRRLPSL